MRIHELFEDSHLSTGNSKWSTPAEDLFKGTAEQIADAVTAGAKSVQQALTKLANLAMKAKTPAEKSKVADAKKIVQAAA